eukprot:4121856-Karenia_brevis.AAC.1
MANYFDSLNEVVHHSQVIVAGIAQDLLEQEDVFKLDHRLHRQVEATMKFPLLILKFFTNVLVVAKHPGPIFDDPFWPRGCHVVPQPGNSR